MSNSKRKFYKTVLKVEVLSEEPFMCEDLGQVGYAITEGDCSGVMYRGGSRKISAKTMAKELVKQGSDPEFFGLDDKGNDLEEEK